MKTIQKLTVVLCILAGALVAPSAKAQTFNWGGTVSFGASQDKYYTSSGSQLTTAGYTFEIGYFSPGFTPTAGNISLWSSNFTQLDNPSFDGSNDHLTNGIPWTFGGTSYVSSTVSNGQQAYLWISDAAGATGSAGGEVYLGTGSTWTLPTYGASTPAPTYDFTNTTQVVFGMADTTYFNATPGGEIVGAGTITSPVADTHFEAQLASITPAPEPSGALLVGIAGVLTLLRRRSRR